MYTLSKKKRELTNKVETGENRTTMGIPYPVFTSVPDELKLTEDDIGKQVWIANESLTTTAILKKVHGKDEDSWPEGGYEVNIIGTKFYKKYFLNEVILHPDEIRLTESERQRIKNIKKAKKKKYVNPITGRKCSYKYSLDNGFITKTGKKVPLNELKFENPETGRMVSYSYAKQKGII